MATAMHAAQGRLEIAAANLANLSTRGFARHVARVRLGNEGLVTSSRLSSDLGPLQHTGRPFDVTATGGSFFVRGRDGHVTPERSASFERDARGRLIDSAGGALLGERGPLVAGPDATIDERGAVRENGRTIGRLRLAPGSVIHAGFVAGANVDAIGEMIGVLDAQRAFETAQKTLSALDDARQKDVNDVVRVKA